MSRTLHHTRADRPSRADWDHARNKRAWHKADSDFRADRRGRRDFAELLASDDAADRLPRRYQ